MVRKREAVSKQFPTFPKFRLVTMTASGNGHAPSKVARRSSRPVVGQKGKGGTLAWAMDRQLGEFDLSRLYSPP